MNSPIISIIMPVYNAQHTLCRAVESVISQTFRDWVLLLVNDGSNDDSGRICDEYAQKEARIRVIHQKNQGVAAARQTGIEAAQGEYVIHADADDWVEPTMLEELYHQAKEDDADVVICDFYSNKGNKQTYCKQQPSACTPDAVLHDLFQQLHGSCCNKLVRRACYKRYGIGFTPGVNYCEDLLTWVQLFLHRDVRISYLPKAFYHYWQNEGSITHNMTRKRYEELLRYLERLTLLLQSTSYADLIQKAKLSVFHEGVGTKGVMSREEIKKTFTEIEREAFATSSIRWKMGYLFVKLGCYGVARRLLAY